MEQEQTQGAAQTAQTAKKVVVSDVLRMLQEGHDRKAINAHYGLSLAQRKQLWSLPQLKNRKVVRAGEPLDIVVDVEAPAPKATATATEGESLTADQNAANAAL